MPKFAHAGSMVGNGLAACDRARMLTPYHFHGGLALTHAELDVAYEFQQFEIQRGDILRIALNDHVGRASIPVVKEGERVKKFQLLARAAGRVSVAQHAPSSALVLGIERSRVGEQGEACEIVLECDGEDASVTPIEILDLSRAESSRSSHKELLRRIAGAGIVGMGGGGFPGHIKLEEGLHTEVKHLLINAVECEPLADADRHLTLHHQQTIVESAQLLGTLLEPQQIVIAISEQGDEERFLDALAGTNIELLVTPAQYPAGSEKQLIKLLTDHELPLNRLPIHMGVVCFNVATVMAMYHAAKFGEPCISRLVTLNADRRWVVQAPIGVALSDLFSRIYKRDFTNRKFRVGGMMMGSEVEPSFALKKVSNEITVLDEVANGQRNNSKPCIRCGECTAVCPARLQPQKLYEYSNLGDLDSIQDFGLFDCIECGCCSYICPSEIPLVAYFQRSKREVNGLTRQSSQREQLAARYERHLTRQDNATPAERDVTLADISALDADAMDNEIERLKHRLASRRTEKNDNEPG